MAGITNWGRENKSVQNRVLKSKFMEMKPLKKFCLLCCRLLDSNFNRNMLRQRDLDKNF